MTASEFLKAIRALSVRYVERRSELSQKSPTDTAGKRAAFAGFFAPLHYLMVDAISRELGLSGADTFSEILDLGCGTGVCSAAIAGPAANAKITGVDDKAWALDETRWNWRALGIAGRTVRADMMRTLAKAEEAPGRSTPRRAKLCVLGWSVNELDDDGRASLLNSLLGWRRRNHAILIVEPISRRASPWWDGWARALGSPETRVDDWKIPTELPEPLRRLDEAAGFDRDVLKARTILVGAVGGR